MSTNVINRPLHQAAILATVFSLNATAMPAVAQDHMGMAMKAAKPKAMTTVENVPGLYPLILAQAVGDHSCDGLSLQ